jgi:hypothetical protein
LEEYTIFFVDEMGLVAVSEAPKGTTDGWAEEGAETCHENGFSISKRSVGGRRVQTETTGG